MNQVPRLRVSRKARETGPHDPAEIHHLRYARSGLDAMPHVVKFSGGRSSGMMLFIMLESGLLKRERGDLVVFNNTSAEHPATYRFVSECKRRAEQAGIPFFMVEFQTYEDARRGAWQRIPSYRMVNSLPASETNPEGFHQRGEVFEEMLSHRMFVPNQFSRVCTQSLKLETTRQFLRDWLRGRDGIPPLGHGEPGSLISPAGMHRLHLKNGGHTPLEVFLEKRKYVLGQPAGRPGQKYRDFSTAAVTPPRAPEPREYVALIGLRADEHLRVNRVEQRAVEPMANVGYEGEHAVMPLPMMGITREDVNRFWQRQEWGLELPESGALSNCTYCFLKGAANLRQVHRLMQAEQEEDRDQTAGTPSSLEWWQRMERTYGRDMVREQREMRNPEAGTFIGFFGAGGSLSYEALAAAAPDAPGEPEDATLPCDCTE